MAGAGVALLAEILKIVKKINRNSPLRFSAGIGPILINSMPPGPCDSPLQFVLSGQDPQM